MPNTYLVHHGIKGQKWGVRRYQNDDGSLTAAGRERYGGKSDYSHIDKEGGWGTFARKVAKSSFSGRKNVSEIRARNLSKKEKRWQENANYDYTKDGFTKEESESIQRASQKKADKIHAKAEAQRAANANRKAYEKHTSTGKLIAQDLLLSKFGAQNYRAARARGAGRIRATLEAGAGVTPLSTILAAAGNKKAYGKAIVLSGLDNGSEF